MKKIIYILSLLSLLTSCNKDEQYENTTPPNLSDIFTGKQKANNYVTISSSSVRGKVASITISKDFEKKEELYSYNNSRDYLKDVKLTGRNGIEGDEGTEYFSYLDNDFDKVRNLFGKKQNIGYENNKTGRMAIPQEMYFPEEISVSNSRELETIDKNKDLELKWKPDSKNDIDKIAVLLINRGNIEGNKVVKVENLYVSKIVDDIGEYKLSKEELQKFGKNSSIDIILARGNQKILDDTAFTVISIDLIVSKVK